MPFIRTFISISCLLFLGACNTAPIKEKSRAQVPKAPDENRLTQTVFLEGLKEPMELAVTEKSLVFWVEQYGEVNLYDPTTGKATLLGKVDVLSGNNDGLLGLAFDPDFESNQQLYLFYSPTTSAHIEAYPRMA